MRFFVCTLLAAVALGQCQPDCVAPQVCDASTAPGRCVEDPCRTMQCVAPQRCRVDTVQGMPKAVCYTPSCDATQQQQCQAPQTKCSLTATGGVECTNPCQSAGTSGPVCPQSQPICTPNADGTVKCSGPCDDPAACPQGSTCRADGVGGKTCVYPDPCNQKPCSQRNDKKCVSDTSATPPTFTCVNACDPNPCSGTTATQCTQMSDAPFYTCSAPVDPCSRNPCQSGFTCRADAAAPNGYTCISPCENNPCTGAANVCVLDASQPNGYKCQAPDPCNGNPCTDALLTKCIVDQSTGVPTAKCINPCNYGTSSPCSGSSAGPVCKPTSASPYFTCTNPCANSQCVPPKPQCIIVEGQASCVSACSRSPSPCQTGTCVDTNVSPFYTCNTQTNPCEPSPCDAAKPVCVVVGSGATATFRCEARDPCAAQPCQGTTNVCVVDATQPNGYKCQAPDPCRDKTCDDATKPKCVVEQVSGATPTAKCVDPCTYGTANPCSGSSAGPVCRTNSAAPYFTCSNPCANMQCTSPKQCVVVDGQASCVGPCNRSPSPCQTGTCTETNVSPFYTCNTNPCQPSPCTDPKPVCVVVGTGATATARCDARNPCDPNPCTQSSGNPICTVDATQANGYKCSPPSTTNPCSPNPCRESPNTFCSRDTSNAAGFKCQDPCANNPCLNTDRPICSRDATLAAGFTCTAPPNPCNDQPCRTNTDGKTACVPKAQSGATTWSYECKLPCDATPCNAGYLCTNTANGPTCTMPATDPCTTPRCTDADKPKCVSVRDPASNTYTFTCVNPCLTAAGNPCITATGAASICSPSATDSKGYTCSAPVASCDSRPCAQNEVCSMNGNNIICTQPDPCAPTASGPRCPAGTNCIKAAANTNPTATNGFICTNPCNDVTCRIGECVAQQTSSGVWAGICPPPCGSDCVSPRRCVQDPASTTIAFKCISVDACTDNTCKTGETCQVSAAGTATCVPVDPCAACTSPQICFRDNQGNRGCRNPCSACSATQQCEIDYTAGTGTCKDDPCLKCQAAGSAGSKCGYDREANGWVCFDDCIDSRCPTGTRCAAATSVSGKFVCTAPPTCAATTCLAGQYCIEGTCKVDPCANCNRADGNLCTKSDSGAYGCFYQPCAVLKPCLQGEVCKDAATSTTSANSVRGYTCVKLDNRATPTAIQVTVSVTLNIPADVLRADTAFNTGFAREAGDLLNVAKERIQVTSIVPSSTGEGSVVTFTVRPADSSATGVQTSSTDAAARLNEKLEAAAASGTQVGNGQYTTAMATGSGAQQVQSAVYQCSNGQWVDSQSACPAPVVSANMTTLAVGVVVGVVGALSLVAAVLYCKKNKTAGGASTGTEMV